MWIDTARSVAEARDKHYHNPPDYLVFEPEDTSARTSNLQQTNTNGYKFQGTAAQLKQAEQLVASWGRKGTMFSHAPEYQVKLAALLGKFKYRLDTNFAKMDRIEHTSLEEFKVRVLGSTFYGRTMVEWARILGGVEEPENRALLQTLIEDKAIKAPEVFSGSSGPSVK